MVRVVRSARGGMSEKTHLRDQQPIALHAAAAEFTWARPPGHPTCGIDHEMAYGPRLGVDRQFFEVARVAICCFDPIANELETAAQV